MAINNLNLTFTDGVTVIDAEKLNAIVDKLNELVEAANSSSSQNSWEDYVDSAENIENNEFEAVYLDSNDMLIVGIRADGTSYRANIDSSSTDKDYSGAALLAAIDSMENQYRPQINIVS